MAWWQVIAVFVGIPAALFALITFVVLVTTKPPLPGGIAARVTHGELFRDFLKLRKGDKVVVETRTKIFTYKLRDNGTDRTLDFTVGWPLMSNPIDRNFIPTKPILTMLTCSELFHTRNRNVVFGDLVSTAEKSSKVSGTFLPRDQRTTIHPERPNARLPRIALVMPKYLPPTRG